MSPLKDEEQPSGSFSRNNEAAKSSAKTILLVEDEKLLREMMALDLQEQGAEVRMAVDGAEAIESIDHSPPDLILLDILMPRKDGFAVLKHLLEKEYAIPVVILSNLGAPDQEQLCRQMGAKDFIVKSDLDTGELWGRIKKHLSQ